MAVSLPYPIPDPATGEFSAFALKQNLEFLARLLTSIQSGQLMPSGGMIFVRSGVSCPSGFNAVASYNGRYVRLGATAGVTGADSSIAVAGVPTSTTVVAAGVGTTVSSSTHLHDITIVAAPAFVDLVLCEKT